MKQFKATVWHEFIKHRDSRLPKCGNNYFRADAEFPEHHQARIDPSQTLSEEWFYDTTHITFGNIDYKQYATAGIKISYPIQKCIKEGITDTLCIWRWLPANNHSRLEEGMEVEYEIMHHIPAKLVLPYIKNERFDLEAVINVEK